jgi:predicted porin
MFVFQYAINKRKSKMKKTLIASLIASAVIFSAQASEPSFDYIQVGMNQYDDADSWELDGSFKLNNDFFITGNYESVSLDQSNVDIDTLSLGFGYLFNLSKEAALYTKLEYINLDATNAQLADDSGYSLGVGMKTMIMPNTELFTEVKHVDIGGSSTRFELGAKHYFSKTIGGYVKYERDDFGDDRYGVGVSVNF